LATTSRLRRFVHAEHTFVGDELAGEVRVKVLDLIRQQAAPRPSFETRPHRFTIACVLPLTHRSAERGSVFFLLGVVQRIQSPADVTS